MSINIAYVQDIASGTVTGGTGVALRARGCATARTGAGVYTITINPNNLAGPELDFTESISKINSVGATPLTADLVHTSDTVKTVTMRNDAGVATDGDFSFRLGRLAG
jgi:hypothetical protein